MADAAETKETRNDLDDLSKLNKQQLRLIEYVVTLVVVAAVLVTLILSFHYRRSSDTTSVLEVIAPIFTAIIGVVLGGGAGIAAGSAGKRAIRDQRDAAHARLEVAKTRTGDVGGLYKKVMEILQTNLDSRSGQDELGYASSRAPNGETVDVVKFSQLDEINRKLGELKGILE